MNEFQDLLQKSLIDTGHVEHAAIIRRSDYTLRAASIALNSSQEQIEILVDLFKDLPAFRENGVMFNAQKYKTIRADRFSIYGKSETGGLVLVKTKSYIIFASYAKPQYASVCVEATESLGSYFKEKEKKMTDDDPST